jgi:predicted phosphodiesterase
MRYGVFADIHANLHALQLALEVFRREGVDGYLCAGDLVGYGPFPNECVDVVAGLGGVCVAGNHDLMALERLPDDRCGKLVLDSQRWTRRVMREDVREFLAGLPPWTKVGEDLAIAHGTPENVLQGVGRPEQGAAVLNRLAELCPEARFLILGHTHRPWAYEQRRGAVAIPEGITVTLAGEERWVLNPGSVGQSRDRLIRVRFMILDLEREQATFYSLPYDHHLCRQALRRYGRPAGSCHLPPSSVRTYAGRLRRLARSALARMTASKG